MRERLRGKQVYRATSHRAGNVVTSDLARDCYRDVILIMALVARVRGSFRRAIKSFATISQHRYPLQCFTHYNEQCILIRGHSE
jgi:hypothetical protein